MLDAFLPQDVMTGDQLARLATEQTRLRSARSDPLAQLLHLSPRRFFAECRLVDVGSSIDVAVPLRSDLLRGDFRIHHRKACGYRGLEVNDLAFCCRAERNAQRLVLPRVDVRAGVDHVEGAIIRRGSEDVAPLMRESCSKHIRRESFAFDFLFRPRPAHHATARFHRARLATCTPSGQSTRRRSRAPSWRHRFCTAVG